MPLTSATLPALSLISLRVPGGSRLLLQDAGSEGGPNLIIMLAVPLIIFWFVLIWPERKERKRKARMLENLKKNDRVLTTFGMYASVAAVSENDLTLRLDEGNTRVRVLKSSIASVIDPEQAAKEQG